jgi:hypothetical protein
MLLKNEYRILIYGDGLFLMLYFFELVLVVYQHASQSPH